MSSGSPLIFTQKEYYTGNSFSCDISDDLLKCGCQPSASVLVKDFISTSEILHSFQLSVSILYVCETERVAFTSNSKVYQLLYMFLDAVWSTFVLIHIYLFSSAKLNQCSEL